MIRIAICDDDKVILDYVYNQIKVITDELSKNTYVQAFLDGNEMLTGVTKDTSQFSILFLDIDMPIVTGFEIAEFIRKFNDNLLIVFLTSMDELVYESFKYKPFRFIRKNKLNEELREVLHLAIAVVEKNSIKYCQFRTEYGEVKFNINDIQYIECINRKVYLIPDDNKQHNLIGIQFSEIVDEFLDKGFILIHRTCIVNLKYIFSIGKLDITLDNGKKLPVSRYKINDVKRAFTLYAE